MKKEELIKQIQKYEPLLANAVSHMKITIAAIPVLDNYQLDKLQNVLDHIAYDKEYYMPDRGYGMHR